MEYQVKSPKKLIEVALPLDAINVASAREKSIRHGHPSTLHLWWARRPLAAARAVIFAQLVNDPSWKWEMENPGEIPPNNLKASWAAGRRRLFTIIEDLVTWENTTNEEVLERARVEIRKSWKEVCELNKKHPKAMELFNPDKLPAFHDPFAGGGALPLEAQRLGLESFASDLNPVAVLINKAMIEIPPKFYGKPPLNPEVLKNTDLIQRTWKETEGLAEDIRYYGKWIWNEAEKRIGNLYPKIEITPEIVSERPDLSPYLNEKLTVITTLWARTVKSPNPAFSDVEVPLATTFMISTKSGKEAYVEPIISGQTYKFKVKIGKSKNENTEIGTKSGGSGTSFLCLMSGAPMSFNYIRTEAKAGRMGEKLMCIVAEGNRGRLFISPTPEMEAIAKTAKPTDVPESELPEKALGFRVQEYGMTHWRDLFTPRQLVTLTTFSNLVREARGQIKKDFIAAGLADDGKGLVDGGVGALAYADAIGVYLALAVDRMANTLCTIARWTTDRQQTVTVFSRQAIPMTWDYPDVNPFANAAGDYCISVDGVIKGIPNVSVRDGFAFQADAATQSISLGKIVSTDPPYYDNIGYADLSDFFYVWLRTALKPVFPELFSTLAVPKAEELVATPFRHGSKEKAEAFFLFGMTKAMHRLSEQAHQAFPVTVYYAFKQSETENDEGTASTGWETFLDAVIKAGFALTGTWPMRTELGNRMVSMGTNALASSIVLVCRKRSKDSPTTSRREFLRELNKILPEALDEMTKGAGDDRSPVAPVDLSQAIIGPGMGVFSKYSSVLEADGSAMSVRTALQLINRFLAEDDFDPDTQFCLHWFEQNGWNEGPYGDAETWSRSKGTSVDGVKESGVVESGGGKVRLHKWVEYPNDWNPKEDARNPVWETLHHLIRALKQDGESAAGLLLANTKGQMESVRQLAYRLYTLCERKGWTEDARAYNELITSWTGIETSASQAVNINEGQLNIFGE